MVSTRLAVSFRARLPRSLAHRMCGAGAPRFVASGSRARVGTPPPRAALQGRRAPGPQHRRPPRVALPPCSRSLRDQAQRRLPQALPSPSPAQGCARRSPPSAGDPLPQLAAVLSVAGNAEPARAAIPHHIPWTACQGKCRPALLRTPAPTMLPSFVARRGAAGSQRSLHHQRKLQKA